MNYWEDEHKVMRRTSSIFFLVLCAFLMGCKESAVHQPLVLPVSDSQFPLNHQMGGDFSSIAHVRNQVEAIINLRKENHPKIPAMLLAFFFHPNGAIVGQRQMGESEFEGYWLKFNDDFTYIFGQFDMAHGSGRFHFRLEDGELVMLDDNPAFEPKIWELKQNSDYMVLVGKNSLGIRNGSIQARFVALDNRPSKS